MYWVEKMTDMILANQNDTYIFFEVIEQLEPQSILDVGMFLKRTGTISRKAMDTEVPANIQLDGIDFFPEINFPVWKNIYNRITDYQVFFKDEKTEKYDLVILLGAEELSKQIPLNEIMNKARTVSRYVLVDGFTQEWQKQSSGFKVADLKVEEDVYFLIDFGRT